MPEPERKWRVIAEIDIETAQRDGLFPGQPKMHSPAEIAVYFREWTLAVVWMRKPETNQCYNDFMVRRWGPYLRDMRVEVWSRLSGEWETLVHHLSNTPYAHLLRFRVVVDYAAQTVEVLFPQRVQKSRHFQCKPDRIYVLPLQSDSYFRFGMLTLNHLLGVEVIDA